MASEHIFERYELKYLVSLTQYTDLLYALQPYIRPDRYPTATIGSLYYDTPDRRLIRRSLEHPYYKEKLRVRSYGAAGGTDPVFVELKKKYDHVVYKRRVALPCDEAYTYLETGRCSSPNTQILREIGYCRQLYPALAPSMLLLYDREAFVAQSDPSLRITFDRRIRFRTQALSLSDVQTGEPLLPDACLLEVKTSGALPLWLLKLLGERKLYRTSFSKYGRAFELVNARSRTDFLIHI